jgi:hypothetical protein
MHYSQVLIGRPRFKLSHMSADLPGLGIMPDSSHNLRDNGVLKV